MINNAAKNLDNFSNNFSLFHNYFDGWTKLDLTNLDLNLLKFLG